MMELYPGGGNGRRVAPFLNSNSCQIGAGPQNQNAKGAVESDIEIQPEMYDFSSFLEGDIVDAVFPEFRDMLKAACLPRTGPVVPERVEEVSANKNMEHRVQIPPPPPPHPPQHLRPMIFSSTRASVSLKWTKELHACFVNAVRRLGGAFIATPKTVRDIMNVDGLGLHQVKSHLQIYRMGKRFCNDWKKFYERGPLFARALGAPSTPAPSSQPDGEKKRRGRPKKQDNGSLQSRRGRPKKHDNESLRMNIQFQKNLLSILEAQNQYVKVAVSRMAAYRTMGGYAYAANQNRGYPFAANQNRGYPFAANQNIGGQVFPLNQKMGGSALAGTRTYPENIFVRQSTTTPMPSRYPHQMNQYNSSISAAATHAGIWPARKPNELQCMSVPYSHPLTQGSFSGNAASGLYKQGFNFNPGKSSGTKVMSDEEFIESLLLHYDELIGKSG